MGGQQEVMVDVQYAIFHAVWYTIWMPFALVLTSMPLSSMPKYGTPFIKFFTYCSPTLMMHLRMQKFIMAYVVKAMCEWLLLFHCGLNVFKFGVLDVKKIVIIVLFVDLERNVEKFLQGEDGGFINVALMNGLTQGVKEQ